MLYPGCAFASCRGGGGSGVASPVYIRRITLENGVEELFDATVAQPLGPPLGWAAQSAARAGRRHLRAWNSRRPVA